MSRHHRSNGNGGLGGTGQCRDQAADNPLRRFGRRVLAVDVPPEVPNQAYRRGYLRQVGMVIPITLSMFWGIHEVDPAHAYLSLLTGVFMLVTLAHAYRGSVINKPQLMAAYVGWHNLSRWLGMSAGFYFLGTILGSLFLPDTASWPYQSTWLRWAIWSAIGGFSSFHALRQPINGNGGRRLSWLMLIAFGLIMPLAFTAAAIAP